MKAKYLIFLIMLICISSAYAIDYSKNIPTTVEPGTEFEITHTFSNIGLETNKLELGVSQELFQGLTLKDWTVSGVENNRTQNQSEDNTYRWVFFPKDNKVVLTLTLKAPNEATDGQYRSIAVYPPGELKREVIDIKVKEINNPPELVVQWDNDDIEKCWDGTKINKRPCINGRWGADTGEKCPPPECTEDLTKECRNGTVTIKKCVNGKYEATGDKCPMKTSTIVQLVLLALLIIGFLGYSYYKKRKKDNESQDNEMDSNKSA